MINEEGGALKEPCSSERKLKSPINRWSSFAAVLLHIKDHAIERIADFFAWWAAKVFDHPYKFIIGTLTFVLLTCIGFLPGIPVWIDGAEALYSLPYSTARSQGAVHKVLFNETSARPSFILITGQTPGENIFTWEHLEAVLQLDRLIRGKIVDPKHGRRIGIARKEEYGRTPTERKAANRPPKQTRLNTPTTNVTLGSNISNEDGAPIFAEEIVGLLNNATLNKANPEDDRGDAGLDILTFQDICARNSFGDCQVAGILEMGVFDLKNLLNPGDPPTLFLFDGLAFNAKKKAFPPHYLLGHADEMLCSPELPKSLLSLFYSSDQIMEGGQKGMGRANMSCIARVEAFQLIYEIADRGVWSKRNEDWERVLVDVVADNMDFGPLKVAMSAFRSRDDALRASTSESSDVLFVAFTFALLVAYSTSLNFSCDLYRSKSYPALSGVVAAILGMIAGMGLASLCGIAFVPTALVCPFLVVGVGVDDMFVIINCYSLAYMVDSARHRCILSLKDTGLAITITTATSLISFIIGLNTEYLSIKNFCWFCGAGMFFGYIFVLTFFFAFHCLDAKREEENMACLFFVPKNERREARRQELRSEGVAFSNEADITTFTLGALMVRRYEQDALRRHALRLHRKKKQARGAEGKGGKLMLFDAEKKEQELTYSETQETVGTLSPEVRDEMEFNSNEKQQKKRNRRNNRCCSGFAWLREKLEATSDRLLSRVALQGHRVAKQKGLDPTPSNGILEFDGENDHPSTGDPLIDILRHPEVPLYYYSTTTGEKKLFIMEPPGSVGLKWRQFLVRYYGPFLVHPISKILVFLLFGAFLAVGLYGCSQLKSGLDLKDLAPKGSYLNNFDRTIESFFSEYDFPVDIFFPEFQRWWTKNVQESLRELETKMRKTKSGKLVMNPLIRMLDDPELIRGLQSGEQEVFEKTLYNALALENGKYKQFEQNFIWEGSHLRAWKMQILPSVMRTSADRAAWMTQIRRDCEEELHNNDEPLVVMAYNYMMTFYESDLQINSSVATNMIVAAFTMLIVAMIGIPQLMAGFMVIMIMGMIDVGILGFMYMWNVKLSMVSMICLLLSVGFSVDFSAHVCHTFMDAEGQTRNQRAIECLVIMGNPVFHGAVSSILGVLMLGFSTSYIFRVFFKMMTMVTVFALVHSVVFLPVLLSVVGSSEPHHQQKKGRQLQIVSTGEEPAKTRMSETPDAAIDDVSQSVNDANNNNNKNKLLLPKIRSRRGYHQHHHQCSPHNHENRHYNHHHLVRLVPCRSPTESCERPNRAGALQRIHALKSPAAFSGRRQREGRSRAHSGRRIHQVSGMTKSPRFSSLHGERDKQPRKPSRSSRAEEPRMSPLADDYQADCSADSRIEIGLKHHREMMMHPDGDDENCRSNQKHHYNHQWDRGKPSQHHRVLTIEENGGSQSPGFPEHVGTKRPATTAGRRFPRQRRRDEEEHYGYDDETDHDDRKQRGRGTKHRQQGQLNSHGYGDHLANRGWRSPSQPRRLRQANECSDDGSSTNEWVDEDCRIALSQVMPTDVMPKETLDWRLAERNVAEGESEMGSPDRTWKSPVVRRKQPGRRGNEERDCQHDSVITVSR